MKRFVFLCLTAVLSLPLSAFSQIPCESISYFNTNGSEYVYTTTMPTVWWAVKMTPHSQFLGDDVTVDTAYIAFGITKNNTPLQYDSLEVRILADTLPIIKLLDYYKAGIMPNFNGQIPDDYWVVELAFPNPNQDLAVIPAYKSFWLNFRLLGPAADEARIRMLDPAANPDRSVVLFPNGTTQRVTEYLHSGTFRDSIDLWAETRVCYFNRVPVELMSFAASYRDGSGVLEWITASETSNFGFDIERADSRSNDGRITLWHKIGFVNGHGTSSMQHAYTFIDQHPESVMDEEGVVRYRLRQIDYDGRDTRSPVVELQIPVSSAAVQLFQNYPNPVEKSAGASTIAFMLPDKQTVRLEMFALLGRPVAVLAEGEYDAGRHTVALSSGQFVPGSYIYVLTSGSTRLLRRFSVLH